MRFDGNVYYHQLERYPMDRMMDEWREEAKLFDESGFTTIWLGEHHFWYHGHNVAAPNPVLVGTHLATLTKRLRVGQSACILPDWHPIRLAEDLAMLDQITRGRLDVGIARGVNSSAAIQFNVNADRRDQGKNYALFKETLEIMIKAWTEEAFTYKGRFYTFPVPGWKETDPRAYANDPSHYAPDGELIGLGVMPKPYQKPYPPIWQAADSTRSYAFAAEWGHSCSLFGRSFEGVREAWTRYQEVASRVHGRPIPLGETPDGRNLNVMRTTYLADTQERAEKEARDGINAYFGFLAGVNGNWGRKGSLAVNEPLTNDDLNADWFDYLQAREIIWVGSPDYVAEKIDHLRSELNCRHITLWPNPIFLPFKSVMHSLELFADKVMPRFQRQKASVAQVTG